MLNPLTKTTHIKHKLILINLFTTGIALLLAGGAILLNIFVSSRDFLLYNLTAEARIVAGNSTAPLTFNDQKAAVETLSALKASPGIVCAVIYGRDGSVFAEYRRAGSKKAALPPAPRNDGHSFDDSSLSVFQRIVLDRETIGSIHISSDLEKLHSLMAQYAAVAAVVIAVVFAIAFILLSKLQKIITEPLFELSRLMQMVSRERNYSLRANLKTDDEIGFLAKGFNEMLGQIQERDIKLQVEIAERKLAEGETRKLNEELELKVLKRTRQLVEAQKELVQNEKLAMLGLIAGGMGNELRNPLGVMNNAVFFLQSVMPDADETVTEYLDIIKCEIENAQGIISDLLDYYQIKSPRTEPVSVRELVSQALKRCVVPENVQVLADMPETSPAISVDPRQMEQVLRNLVTNAVQAMPDGGTLRVAARKSPSPLPPYSSQELVEISVEDTGVGIAPENMEKLFQPLFTTKSRGIGLGLAFSRKLIEANGGRIEVESSLGEGTTFTLTLPADSR